MMGRKGSKRKNSEKRKERIWIIMVRIGEE